MVVRSDTLFGVSFESWLLTADDFSSSIRCDQTSLPVRVLTERWAETQRLRGREWLKVTTSFGNSKSYRNCVCVYVFGQICICMCVHVHMCGEAPEVDLE